MLPERTVDAWLSVYLSDRFPLLGIWAPTRGWDFELDPGIGPGKAVFFECKTARRRGNPAGNVISVDLRQLWEYVHGPGSSVVYYVLPNPPAAFNPRPAGALPAPPPESRFLWTCQSWFYLISAWGLWAHYRTGALVADLSHRLLRVPCGGLASLPGARPLWRFAQELENCTIGLRIEPLDDAAMDTPSRPLIPPAATPPTNELDEYDDWQGLLDWDWPHDHDYVPDGAQNRVMALHVRAEGLPSF